MVKINYFISSILFVIVWTCMESIASGSYIVILPKIFHPAELEVISVRLGQDVEEIVQVSAQLFDTNGLILTETKQNIEGFGQLKLKVPYSVVGLQKASFKICGNCENSGEIGFKFQNSTEVEIASSGSTVFIQTDKPIYKPAQKVFINLIIVGSDLNPRLPDIKAYITDPKGSRLMQWTDLKPFCNGIINLEYPLSDQPMLGEWNVHVDAEAETYKTPFEVKKYVLPKIEVIIIPPSYIVNWNQCETINILARYTYGKPVVGHVTVSATLIGLGYYKDFQGKTLIKILKIDGQVSVEVCIYQLISVAVSDHFRGALVIDAEVISRDKLIGRATDDSCAVNKHIVDIEFTKDTRKHFKPELPFKGKLNVFHPDGSLAQNVTLLVKADVNGEMFIAKEYYSDKGQITFDLPALPSLAQTIWLEAKLLRINNEEMQDKFLSAYKSITSWYSPSKCHILADVDEDTLEIGNDVKIKVQSNCGCNFTLYYEIISRGNIIHSGSYSPTHSVKRSIFDIIPFFNDAKIQDIEIEEQICHVYFSAAVVSEMAPTSRLLVYYIRSDGEGITDDIQFYLKPLFKFPLSMEVSTVNAYPGQRIDFKINSKSDSCVCMSAVDKSLYLLNSAYRISTDKVFSRMADFDAGLDDSDENYWWGINNRKKRSSFWWNSVQSKDAHFAFLESGVLVLTDLMTLNHKQNPDPSKEPVFQKPEPGFLPMSAFTGSYYGSVSGRRRTLKKRAFFPETWIWKCFNESNSPRSHTSMSMRIPDTVTDWVVESFALSPKFGLSLAQPTTITSFKPFFLEFNLPFAVIRGEQVKTLITVYNYMDQCTEVFVTLHLPDEVKLLISAHSTQHVCVDAHETFTITAVLVFSKLGTPVISANGKAYSCPRKTCHGTNNRDMNQEMVDSDHVTQKVLVEPEGIARFYVHSVFFCPNERVLISTPNKYEFQFLKKPRGVTEFVFEVKANNNVHVGLAMEPKEGPDMYEIVIGGLHNTKSWISKQKGGLPLVSLATEEILNKEDYKVFWISWNNGIIKVGYGNVPSRSTVFISYNTETLLIPVQYVGFSTGWGSLGEFRVWAKEDRDGTFGEVFHLSLPHNVIYKSERAIATIIGDVMGPTLMNLDQLLRLPSGCGEQNMIHFAPNVFILKYLQRINKASSQVTVGALNYLIEGYQRQLTYKRADGSYSAFGERDASGSIWLTAFVAKSFAQAKEFIFIDNQEILKCISWIVSKQEKNGSFPAIGKILNKNLQGGAHGEVALTAYVVIALLESEVNTYPEKNAVFMAKKFLENQTALISDPYTAALASYALTLVKSESAIVALRKLDQMATKKDGFTYWKLSGSSVEYSYFHDDFSATAPSAEVEMTAYALLTYTARGDIAATLPIVKWLSQQRNSLGGFSSTQDTCVALQALAEYAVLAFNGNVNLTISLASTNLDFQEKFLLNPNNSNILQSAKIPSIPTGLFVGSTGEGCALLQIDINYHIPDPATQPSFQLEVRLIEKTASHSINYNNPEETLHDNRLFPTEQDKTVLEMCVRWLHHGSSNMALAEVSLPTGFEADLESLETLLESPNIGLKRYEIDGRKVIFYFDEIPSKCLTCLKFDLFRRYIVGKMHPVPIRIFDYYEPAYEAIKLYNVSQGFTLAQDLCEGNECNEIKEETIFKVKSPDGCLSGCGEFHYGRIEQCACYRDCPEGGAAVCGSDGLLYDNLCRMEVKSCDQGKRLEVVPVEICRSADLNFTTSESSGEVSTTGLDFIPSTIMVNQTPANQYESIIKLDVKTDLFAKSPYDVPDYEYNAEDSLHNQKFVESTQKINLNSPSSFPETSTLNLDEIPIFEKEIIKEEVQPPETQINFSIEQMNAQEEPYYIIESDEEQQTPDI